MKSVRFLSNAYCSIFPISSIFCSDFVSVFYILGHCVGSGFSLRDCVEIRKAVWFFSAITGGWEINRYLRFRFLGGLADWLLGTSVASNER